MQPLDHAIILDVLRYPRPDIAPLTNQMGHGSTTNLLQSAAMAGSGKKSVNRLCIVITTFASHAMQLVGLQRRGTSIILPPNHRAAGTIGETSRPFA